MSIENKSKKYAAALIRDRLSVALSESMTAVGLPVSAESIKVERPLDAFGDFASNVAIIAAKQNAKDPVELAGAVVAHMQKHLPAGVAAVSVAGNGFINFSLHPSWLLEALKETVESGVENYASHSVGAGSSVLLEFVSANPTGPIHVGNGWWGSCGDALGRLLKRCGYDVTREYYVNDTGGQIRRLGESLLARKRGEDAPDDGCQGAYVTELAAQYDGEDDIVVAGRWAAGRILETIKSSLTQLDIEFDSWFSQASIEESGAVAETIALLKERGLVYEQEGATYLKSTECGDSRDRVLIKSNGDFTYLAGDLAYHRNKLLVRNFLQAIDIFGADHSGQVASLKAGIGAMGIDADRLEVRLGQMISLAEGKMSKRTGNFVALSSLIDDIGPGAVRFLSLTGSINKALTLDLQMARSKTMDNPVHYVRYAYARIASIGRQRAERNVERLPLEDVDLRLLTHATETAMLRSLSELPDVVLKACNDRAPHLVTTWLRKISGEFHSFYHDCFVLHADVPPELTQARLWLIEAVQIGLTVGLNLIGVSAPERM